MVHEFNEVFMQVLILLALSVGVSIIAKYFKQPYSIALVIVGLVIGLLHLPIIGVEGFYYSIGRVSGCHSFNIFTDITR